ncbi:metallophosphoesterase [Pleionea sp. CnH1-48]|uniref:metallophosphoesterase n=1 Tax=Pleionea sp. CnH1-48 TaxID=2954494 RepID=UPI002097557B|nr:metallophosphoesterase [Pleionea sp. CnH1-48]MCO7224073.1 metallophosphoesterase [Pleionea sp. CnH1-48]
MEKYFAVVGDVHGHMDRMVSQLTGWEKKHHKKLSFVLQVGDFEPHRSENDLSTMAAPSKYKQLGDFHRYLAPYHSRFPWPIYFIGGNHEPYGYLESTASGSLVADNCVYLGRTGVIKIEGINVAGLSGIYREDFFYQSRPAVECIAGVPNKLFAYYNWNDLAALSTCKNIEVILLHDWPTNIISTEQYLALSPKKKLLEDKSLGSPATWELIETLKPKWVFCGHMHVPYRTQVTLRDGHQVNICCLSSVCQGRESFRVFKLSPSGAVEYFVAE